MTPERFARLRDLFGEALDVPAPDRERFVRARAGGDLELASEVLRMLEREEAEGDEPGDGFAVGQIAGALVDSIAAAHGAEVAGDGVELSVLGLVLADRYRIEELIGSGGMSRVFRSVDLRTGATVAVKLLHAGHIAPVSVDRLIREAKVVEHLKHPNIVAALDFAIDPELGAYFVMELLSGRSLREELDARGRLALDEALAILRQTVVAIEAAHSVRIIHRDLKPENIFLVDAGDGRPPTVKVLDFGIAKILDGGGGTGSPATGDRLTATGTVIGTPRYMSPEQCRGEALDTRSDVYSLGCVLYEILTGRPPFDDPDVLSVLFKQANEAAAPPTDLAPDLPRAIDAAIWRALAKERSARYARASEMLRAVEAASAGVRISARSGRGAPHNLPAAATSFIGRECACAEVTRLIAEQQLLTLVGPGGCGKTRMALEVASRSLHLTPDGIWFVTLAPVSEPDLVLPTVAATVGVGDSKGRPLDEALVERLRGAEVLLLLDNCEHVLAEAARIVAGLLAQCPELRILATSRAPLGVAGEHVWAVPAMGLPDAAASVEETMSSEAVRLFAERATAASPRFVLSAENVGAVVEVCRQLDGIPLAIELAAARARILAPEEIATRLQDRFRLLTGGSEDADPRQRTLRAAMDWSYGLLTGAERTLCNRLSVFAGGWRIGEAERVCAGDGVDELEVLDLMTSLVDKSLVRIDGASAGARFSMLETVRAYARLQLERAGETAQAREQHLEAFLALAEEAAPELIGPEQIRWLARLDAEVDNVRVALDWAEATPTRAGSHARLVSAVGEFWRVRGYLTEGSERAERAIAVVEPAETAEYARLLYWSGFLAGRIGDYDRAWARLDAALAIRRRLGDLSAVAETLNQLGFVLQWRGDYDRAERIHTEALEAARASGDVRQEAIALNNFFIIAVNSQREGNPTHFLEAAAARFEQCGDRIQLTRVISNLGAAAGFAGDHDRALELYAATLALAEETGDRWSAATAILNTGETLYRAGQYDRALARMRESIDAYELAGERRSIGSALESIAAAFAASGDAERAFVMLGLSEAIREQLRAPRTAREHDEVMERLAGARALLGDDRSREATARGRALLGRGAPAANRAGGAARGRSSTRIPDLVDAVIYGID
jgi:non-specific serine/threonine protein kinase